MNLSGVHLLLTYRCDNECDHCFVWGSPSAKGVMRLRDVFALLTEARRLGTVRYVSIEGGEPFLYYPVMVRALREAARLGYRVEVLSNCYWATSEEDAVEWLLPIAQTGNAQLSLSSDPYHGEGWETEGVKNAVEAAKKLGIPVGIISIEDPRAEDPCPKELEGVKVDCCELMYRGRAASRLVGTAVRKPWTELRECPYEDLRNPSRVHVDPMGYVHVCQGISLGNAWQRPFSEIMSSYDPSTDPVIGPLMRGGPVALIERYGLLHDETYADACHLCYEARLMLRDRFPSILAPGQMYSEGLE